MLLDKINFHKTLNFKTLSYKYLHVVEYEDIIFDLTIIAYLCHEKVIFSVSNYAVFHLN